MVTLAFSEKDQVFAGCLDNLVCQDEGGQIIEHTKCIVDDDCTATSKAKSLTSLRCGAHPDKATSTIPSLPINDGLASGNGNAKTSKLRNKYGLEVNKYLANGRAAVSQIPHRHLPRPPIWDADQGTRSISPSGVLAYVAGRNATQ